MKPRIQNLFLLSALTAGLGLMPAGPAAAQTFTNLHSFTALSGSVYAGGTNSDGANPLAVLVLSGNTLYGTAANGGTNGSGAVFKVNTDGTGFTNLYSFSATVLDVNSDGANPSAGLILSGSTLYGTTSSGGSSGNGTVFAINTNGTGFRTIYSFSGGNDGVYPYAALILSGSTLYGTAENGGNSDNGTVFAVNTNGTFTTLHSFSSISTSAPYNNSDGANPQGGLILSGNTLYGTANIGGSSGNGTVFAVNTNGPAFTFTTLHSFTAIDPTYYTNSDGANPQGNLILSGNTLFGTAESGGSSDNGTVFAVITNASGNAGFTTLHSFNGGSDGANPQAGLILSGNALYGTANAGGSSGDGTVFAVNTNGTGFTTLHSLNGGSDGAYPRAGLILSNVLFGTAFQGGHSGNGTVFKGAPLLSIHPPQLSGGKFFFSFVAFPSASYTVQQNTNLAGTNWITFSNIIGSGVTTQLSLPTTNAARLFFRVRQP